MSDEPSAGTTLARVAEQAKTGVPGAAEVSLTMVSDGRPRTPASTGVLARDMDGVQYRRGYGPCLTAARTGRVVEVTDAAAELRWPGYGQVAVGRGTCSSVSVPIPVGDGAAALNVYGVQAHTFTDAGKDLAAVFASRAAAVMAGLRPPDDTPPDPVRSASGFGDLAPVGAWVDVDARAASVALLWLAGEIDLAGASLLRSTLDGLLEQLAPLLVVDVSAVTFIDCSGLGPLLHAHRRATRQGGRVALRGHSRAVHVLLEAMDRVGIPRPLLLNDYGR